MKKIIIKYSLALLFCFSNVNGIKAQSIPFGTSVDSLAITTPANTSFYDGNFGIHYYKPTSYNPATSPILFFIHGLGGDGSSSADLQSIADRQKALIVAPTMQNGPLGWAYATEAIYNNITSCYQIYWYTQVIKQIYRHVLIREARTSINTYLTGFSAGGQFVTRYMLIRQFSPDSIPIKMAMSVNPANYTLMTDTFNNVQMTWESYRCGLAGSGGFVWGCAQTLNIPVKNFICNEHIKQYYNENYGLLIGTADTQVFTGFCPGAQGTDRFDRTKKFYAFSTTNAVTRGTTLKWPYDSVAGVGHNQPAMYNTFRNVTDSFTIAEKLLFKTPFHVVPYFVPTCIPQGISEILGNGYHVSVYPNPTTGSFKLQISNEINKGELILMNALGQKIHEQKVIQGTNNITTNGLSTGLYNYILLEDKQKVSSGKLIIE